MNRVSASHPRAGRRNGTRRRRAEHRNRGVRRPTARNSGRTRYRRVAERHQIDAPPRRRDSPNTAAGWRLASERGRAPTRRRGGTTVSIPETGRRGRQPVEFDRPGVARATPHRRRGPVLVLPRPPAHGDLADARATFGLHGTHGDGHSTTLDAGHARSPPLDDRQRFRPTSDSESITCIERRVSSRCPSRGDRLAP